MPTGGKIMEYICESLEQARHALNDCKSGRGDVFICSDEVFKYICNQPERLNEKDRKVCDSPSTPTKGSDPNRND